VWPLPFSWVFMDHAYRDKKVVGVFVRFRAPLHLEDPISKYLDSLPIHGKISL
jgi:hypothetical protein